MKSFEDLGIAPELTEALAAEGIETPSPLQEAAIPILKKGNNLVLEAGPGSGLLVAWSIGILDRIGTGGDGPSVLVLCATPEIADRLAESTARIAASTGHGVGALGSSWVLPERADILFATPAHALEAFESDLFAAESIETVIVDQAQLHESLTGLSPVEQVLDYLEEGVQRVLSALPMTDTIADLAARQFKRTMTVPAPMTDVPRRGRVRFRIVPEPRAAGTLTVIDELLADGARHVLVYFQSEDRAADVGDGHAQ